MPKVSIIIPTYNGEKFINKTIESVVGQTYKDWELIIVDDFSNDNTKEIIKEWEKEDKRIRSIFLDKNSGGPAHPKNIGIENSKGEYVAFLDHDDEWMPEKLEKQIDFLKNKLNDKYELVTCNFLIDINGEKYKYITPTYNLDSQLSHILNGNFVHSCSSIIVRKKIIDSLGGFDESMKMSDDWDLYLRMLQLGYFIGIVPEVLFIWHSQTNSAGKRIVFEGRSELEYFLKKHKNVYTLHNDVFWKKLLSLSLLCFFIGNFEDGRKYLRESFRIKHNFLSVMLMMLSYFHSVRLFKFIFYLKKLASSNVLEKSINFSDVLR